MKPGDYLKKDDKYVVATIGRNLLLLNDGRIVNDPFVCGRHCLGMPIAIDSSVYLTMMNNKLSYVTADEVEKDDLLVIFEGRYVRIVSVLEVNKSINTVIDNTGKVHELPNWSIVHSGYGPR